ncbi:unnamed protein product [marine sediment metagenome]|uniref:Addiction module antitoxin RelB n=1 Tax=marine sediment metagenome TaxID=412755 RepID=X0U7I1_9ZZZZ
MIKTDELISEAISLPIDIRTQLINRLLVSLNPERRDIDEFWMKEAEERLKDIKTGKVKTVSGEQVFQEIKERFQK